MRRSRRLPCCAVLALLGSLPLAATQIPVSGRVRDSGGAALAEAWVELWPVLSSWERGSRELDGKSIEPAAVTLTGPDGRFELFAPGEGMWEVGVVAKGYVPQRYRLTPLTGPETLFPVRLRRDAGLRVRVEGPDGRPIPGARVIGRTWRDEHQEPGWRTAPRIGVSGADGVARVPGSREESLVLLGTAPGFPVQEGPEARGPGEVVFRLASGTPRRVEAPADAIVRDLQTSLVLGRGGSRIVTRGESWLLLETEEGVRVRFAVPEKGGAVRVQVPAPAPLPGNVIDSAARQPVAGAWVWPRRDPGRFVRTDAQGAYRIQGDDLEVTAAGHLPEVVDSWSFRPEGGLPAVALEPEAFLTGTVEDMEGKPAAGAEVAAFPGMDAWFPPSLIAWAPRMARVSSDGKVRIAGLRPGSPVQVMVMGPGFAPVWLDRGRLEARNNRFVVMLPRGGGVRGRLEDGEGKPIPEARIRIEPAAGTAGVWLVMDPAREKERFTVSAPDGGFAFADLPPGWYDMTVRRPGAAPQRLPRFEVKEGQADLGALRPDEAEVLAARVVDAGGRPVAGAEVWASVLSDPLVLHERSEDGPAAESGADGGVSLRASRWHGLELTVCAPGFVPQAVSVPRFLPEEPLVVTLQRGADVSGRLTGAGGLPVSGRVMHVAPVGKSAAPSLLHDCAGQGWNDTDEAGRFRVGGLEPGLYTVDSGHRLALAAGESRELTVPEGPRTVPSASFSGRILGSDGQPIPGAVVRLAASERHGRFWTFDEAVSRTDADGNYRLSFSRPGLEIDEMSFGISRHGRALLTRAFSSWEGPAMTETDGRVDVAVKNHPMRLAGEGPAELVNQGSGPKPMATISGRILGLAPGEPARVSARSSGEWMAGSVDAHGSYRLEGLQPETWAIRAEAADRTLHETVHIPEGEARIARDLAFPPVVPVSGRVADRGGQAIAGARVRLRHHASFFETQRPDVETRTGSDGRFEVRVPEGSYEVTASREGFVSWEDGSVDVDGDGARADLWLVPAVELRGRLTGLPPDEDELAIEATLVDGLPGYPRRFPGRMIAEGRYVIPGLGPGTWEVEAACNGSDTGELKATGRVEIPEEATEAELDLALRKSTD